MTSPTRIITQALAALDKKALETIATSLEQAQDAAFAGAQESGEITRIIKLIKDPRYAVARDLALFCRSALTIMQDLPMPDLPATAGEYHFLWQALSSSNQIEGVYEQTIYGESLQGAADVWGEMHGSLAPDENGVRLVILNIAFKPA